MIDRVYPPKAQAPAAKPTITFESLFKSDFPDILHAELPFVLQENNQTPLTINVIEYDDFQSNTQFLSIYIPFIGDETGTATYNLIKEIRDQITAIKAEFRHNPVGSTLPGGSYVEWSKLIFSGRIFIYTTNSLTAVQIGELAKWYDDKAMSLQIRGLEYWSWRNKNTSQ